MSTAEDLRRIAMTLPGTSEAPHMDRIAFKAVRTYATLAADGLTAHFKFSPDEQAFKCLLYPEALRPIPNGWGRQGWTIGDLAALDEPALRDALEIAWAHGAAPRPKRRR